METSRPPEHSAWPLLDTAVVRLLGRLPTPVVVAFSGGLDSSVLLHRLATEPRLRRTGLRALHIHHGWSEMADHWAELCVRFAAGLELPCSVVRVVMDRGTGVGGLEAAARRARLAAFAGGLRAREWLLTAHHAEDQAETVLLQLLRGAGLDGLTGMRERTQVSGVRTWRPLLSVPRGELLAYATAHGLPFVEDPSNQDAKLARGFLRARVLPQLQSFWPGLVTTLNQTASCLRADARLVRLQVLRGLAECRTLDPAVLNARALLAQPIALQARILRHWLGDEGAARPGRAWIARVLTELRNLAPDAQPRWRQGPFQLAGWGGLLRRGARLAMTPWCVDRWDGVPLVLPHGLGTLRWQGRPVRWRVHARCGGERLLWHGRSRPLKHLLQTLRVPVWERDRLILVSEPADDGTLVLRAVAGIVVDDGLYAELSAGARLLHEPVA